MSNQLYLFSRGVNVMISFRLSINIGYNLKHMFYIDLDFRKGMKSKLILVMAFCQNNIGYSYYQLLYFVPKGGNCSIL